MKNALDFFIPFNVDIFCIRRKFLVYNLVSRNIKLKYRRSFFGVLWTMVVPALSALTYYLVFQVFVKVPVPNYLLFIISGVLPWSYFSTTAMVGMESLVANYVLLSKVPMPIQVFPFVEAVSNFINLVFALPVVFIIAIATGAPLGASVVLLPFYYFLLFIMVYSLTLILAVGFVYFRDMRHLMGFVMQVWFYLTPIIYSENLVPEKWRWVEYCNPMAFMFSGIHTILIFGDWPSVLQIAITTGWAVLFFGIALAVNRRFAPTLIERV